MLKLFLIFSFLFQSGFYEGGWITEVLKDKFSLNFYIDGRYLKKYHNTGGHGTIISYTLVESNAHFVIANVVNANFDFETWPEASRKEIGNRVRKTGIKDGNYWRTDCFYIKGESGRLCLLHGYGKDSLAINKIMDTAHVEDKQFK